MDKVVSDSNNGNNQPVTDDPFKVNLPEKSSTLMEPKILTASTVSMSTKLSQNEFENIIKSIKSEHGPLVPDNDSDLEDLSEICPVAEKNLKNQENIDQLNESAEYQNINGNNSNKIYSKNTESNLQVTKKIF